VNAAHANAMARRLADGLSALPGVTLTQPVEANAIFATVPKHAVAALERGGAFYVWDERRTEIRLVCAFDTTPGDVDAFIANARRVLAG
jgi:threonine aldolase